MTFRISRTVTRATDQPGNGVKVLFVGGPLHGSVDIRQELPFEIDTYVEITEDGRVDASNGFLRWFIGSDRNIDANRTTLVRYTYGEVHGMSIYTHLVTKGDSESVFMDALVVASGMKDVVDVTPLSYVAASSGTLIPKDDILAQSDKGA